MYVASRKQKGFTIVELLIVVVVIAILAAITIVAYNGISNRARISGIQADLVSAGKALETRKIQDTAEQYPGSLALANINSADMTYVYEAADNSFCLTKTNGSLSYYVSNVQKNPAEGTCESGGMVSWWKFNGNANDSIGANNGTVSNATLATGQNGEANGAYSFNGANANINFGNNASLNQPNITMSIWARPVATNSLQVLLGKELQYKYRFATAGTLVALVSANGSNWLNPQPITASGVAVANTWSHAVMSYDSAQRQIKMYINGTHAGTWPLSMPITSYNTNNFYAGASNGVTESFVGLLDDARFYNKVLTGAEIKGIYNAGAK